MHEDNSDDGAAKKPIQQINIVNTEAIYAQ